MKLLFSSPDASVVVCSFSYGAEEVGKLGPKRPATQGEAFPYPGGCVGCSPEGHHPCKLGARCREHLNVSEGGPTKE